MILGLDEVGRGSWAGPLVVGAVVLGDTKIEGLTDSKKLSSAKRKVLDVQIRQSARGIGLGWVSAEELDQIGLSQALKLASIRAVEQIKTPYHEIIIDGTVNFLDGTTKGKYVTLLKKADLLISAVSSASIVAKVARDSYMENLSGDYLNYNFASNFGYGTKLHSQALDKFGITDEHRKSFAPIAKIIEHKSTSITSRIGMEAQDIAVLYLESIGHRILVCNWRTKYCEIDVVSHFNKKTYFTEVRYRKTASFGSGLESISNKKFQQMKKSAEIYANYNNIDDMILAVASLSSDPMKLDSWIEIV